MSLLHTTPLSLPLKNPIIAGKNCTFPTNYRSITFSTTPSPPKLIFTTAIRFSRPFPDDPISGDDDEEPDRTTPSTFVDEWGEKSDPDPEPATKLADSDPPKNDDEWGVAQGDYVVSGNGKASGGVDESGDERLEELKRCLVDSVYGTDLGVKASSEVRGEVFELVSQLEALNPIPAPTDAVVELAGNWILLYVHCSALPFILVS